MMPPENAEPWPVEKPIPSPADDGTVVVNMADFGPGDPSPLVAGSLRHSTFPRLLRTMEEQPPARSADAERNQPSRGR